MLVLSLGRRSVSRVGQVVMRGMRSLLLFVLLPLILLMNGCSLMMSEQRDAASSGMLTAKVVLINAGAVSDYDGSV